MTPGCHVLTLVACGAGPAAAVGTCVKLAQDRGWDGPGHRHPSCTRLLRRGRYRRPGRQPGPQPVRQTRRAQVPDPDDILVAPATYNTINKWAHGISDTYSLGGPTVVLPFVNTDLAGRAPFRRSVDSLRAEGVQILLGPCGIQPHPPRTGGDLAATSPGTSV